MPAQPDEEITTEQARRKMEEKKSATAATGKLPYEKAEMEIIEIERTVILSESGNEPCNMNGEGDG